MRKALSWITSALMAIVFASVLAFGTHEAVASGPGTLECGPGQFCPDNPELCDQCCKNLGARGGSCEGNPPTQCECFL